MISTWHRKHPHPAGQGPGGRQGGTVGTRARAKVGSLGSACAQLLGMPTLHRTGARSFFVLGPLQPDSVSPAIRQRPRREAAHARYSLPSPTGPCTTWEHGRLLQPWCGGGRVPACHVGTWAAGLGRRALRPKILWWVGYLGRLLCR